MRSTYVWTLVGLSFAATNKLPLEPDQLAAKVVECPALIPRHGRNLVRAVVARADLDRSGYRQAPASAAGNGRVNSSSSDLGSHDGAASRQATSAASTAFARSR